MHAQFILPISVSSCSSPRLRECIYKLGALVRFFSAKEVDPSSLEAAQIQAMEAVCLLEDTFPRSVLTSQVHLLVHVIEDMAICGPVSSRWMFFLERFMKTLKHFVRQNARPEGSMCEGWLI
jgi:hypothetical protein